MIKFKTGNLALLSPLKNFLLTPTLAFVLSGKLRKSSTTVVQAPTLRIQDVYVKVNCQSVLTINGVLVQISGNEASYPNSRGTVIRLEDIYYSDAPIEFYPNCFKSEDAIGSGRQYNIATPQPSSKVQLDGSGNKMSYTTMQMHSTTVASTSVGNLLFSRSVDYPPFFRPSSTDPNVLERVTIELDIQDSYLIRIKT